MCILYIAITRLKKNRQLAAVHPIINITEYFIAVYCAVFTSWIYIAMHTLAAHEYGAQTTRGPAVRRGYRGIRINSPTVNWFT